MEERGGRRKRNKIQQRSKGKEDGRLQVQAVNPHLGSLHYIRLIDRQMHRLSGRGRRGDRVGVREER